MTDLRVAIPWWAPRRVGGSQQAIRGNIQGFEAIGADVDLYLMTQWGDALPLEDRAVDYDLIIWPFLQHALKTEPHEAHVHVTIGGFGPDDLADETARLPFEAADSISFLDPLLADHFARRLDMDFGDARLVLNPPNWALFDGDDGTWALVCDECGLLDRYDDRVTANGAIGGHASQSGHTAQVVPGHHVGGGGHVLTPKVGGTHKTGQLLDAIARRLGDVLFETSIVQPHGGARINAGPALPTNVVVRPGVPLTAMPQRYREAGVVLNVAEREAGPNVAYEAWLSGRPFVCTPDGIGWHKSLPASAVDVGDIGRRLGEWYADRGDAVGGGNGEHYVAAEPDELAGHIRTLLADPGAYHDLASGGRRWLDQLEGYTWASKAQAIVDTMEEA